MRVVSHTGVSTTLGGIEAANDAVTNLTCSGTIGSTSMTVSGTTAINGMYVAGLAGIQPGTFVASGGGTTSLTLNQALTATIPATSSGALFSYTIPLPNVVFATGVTGAQNQVEVTILSKVQA
jgi:hypothetical protein